MLAYVKSELDIQGHKMLLNGRDDLSAMIYLNFYEVIETQLVRRAVKRADVVLDIGANIGYYTLLFARLVGPRGRVYAFEPEPLNFSLLEKNVRANGYRNVVLEEKAVSDEKATIPIACGTLWPAGILTASFGTMFRYHIAYA